MFSQRLILSVSYKMARSCSSVIFKRGESRGRRVRALDPMTAAHERAHSRHKRRRRRRRKKEKRGGGGGDSLQGVQREHGGGGGGGGEGVQKGHHPWQMFHSIPPEALMLTSGQPTLLSPAILSLPSLSLITCRDLTTPQIHLKG